MYTESSSSTQQDKQNKTALSSEQVSELIVSNMELGQKLAWKLLSSWNARLPEDDVRSLVGIALCEAAKNYDGRPGVQFPTFLFYYLRGRLLREISRNVKHRRIATSIQDEVSAEGDFHKVLYDTAIDAPIPYESKNPEKIMISREQDLLVEKALDALDPLEREVVIRYYSAGEAILSIAETLGYCRCHLSRVKTRAISKLKKAVKLQHVAAAEGLGHLSPEELIETVFLGYSGGRGRRKKEAASHHVETGRLAA